MLSTQNRKTSIKMVCGHSDDVSISFKGARQLETERREMSKAICVECRHQLEAWMKSDFDNAPFPMDMPKLKGASASQIAFATRVRDGEFKKYGPLMQALSEMDADLAVHAWRSLYMRFMVTTSRYWLDGQKLFSIWSWANEVRYMMKAPNYDEKPQMNSPYGWFTSVDKDAIAYIRAYNPKYDLKGANLPFINYWKQDMLKMPESTVIPMMVQVQAQATAAKQVGTSA